VGKHNNGYNVSPTVSNSATGIEDKLLSGTTLDLCNISVNSEAEFVYERAWGSRGVESVAGLWKEAPETGDVGFAPSESLFWTLPNADIPAPKDDGGGGSGIRDSSRKMEVWRPMFMRDLMSSVEGPNVGRTPRRPLVSVTNHTQPLVNIPRAAEEKVDLS